MYVASTMTAKDNNNIFKKMKLLKKILDIKCCKQEKCRENCIYEKKNWFTGNKEKLNLFKSLYYTFYGCTYHE